MSIRIFNPLNILSANNRIENPDTQRNLIANPIGPECPHFTDKELKGVIAGSQKESEANPFFMLSAFNSRGGITPYNSL